MIKEKRYELIWSIILIVTGMILALLGKIIYPTIVLVLVIGLSCFSIGIINLIKSVK